MTKAPIFLLGSERSGTNLLRTRLDNHSNILGPIPIHTMAWFYDYEPYYGNLENDNNFKLLVEDMIKSVEVNIHKWDIDFECEQIMKDIPRSERSVITLFGYIYDKYTEKKGKSRWFCKDNDLAEYVWPLNNYFPECKFIYLVRDPRDVCLSNLKRAGGPNTAYHFSNLWKKEQQQCIRVITEKTFKDKTLLVKYEDILSDPEGTFKNICDFLGEEYEKNMIDPGEREESKATRAWKNLSKDIMKDNKKKYLEGLSDKQVKIIEKITRREMKFLDYDLEFENNSYECNFIKKALYEIINKVNHKVRYSTQKEIEKRRERNKLRQMIRNRNNI